MNHYEVQLSFSHTYTMIIEARSAEQAEKIAKEVSMNSGDKRIIEEHDGDFEELLSVNKTKQIR